jgi:tRNA(Arg) A34 adenosine deaminase TadA
MKKSIIRLAVAKASQSTCHYKVSAIGFNHKGDLIGSAINQHRLNKYGGSTHAEVNLIKKYGSKLTSMVICRTNKTGSILPIHPCPRCRGLAMIYGINIATIEG